MPEPARYLHGHHESVLRSHRWRTAENSAAYLLPDLVPGQALLDVGCGPGTLTCDLAARVAPGPVLGVDRSADVLEAARAEAARRGLANVRFEQGDVMALDGATGRYDVVHAHQVLQHLPDPVGALAAMRRACRTGGLVAARDSDYAALAWYPAEPGLDAWLDRYRAVARAVGGEPDAGRHLLAWARAAGFSEVAASASAWCFATAEDRAWWGGLWAERVTGSDLAGRLLEAGLAGADELEAMAAAFRRWAAAGDGWFAVLHGEVRCRP